MSRRLSRNSPCGSPPDTDPTRNAVAPRPPHAILLVETLSQRRVIAACCEGALRRGVVRGMTLAHARALLTSDRVHIEHHDPRREHAALVKLAMWAHRFSPLVAPDPPDGLMMDITGCERAFKGEGRLLRQVLLGADRLGFCAAAAIAPTFGSAWALARFSGRRGVIITPEQLRSTLSPLPIAALRVSPETVIALDELGVETIEHLLSLPRITLPARFGPSLLLRLDQALGAAMESIQPVRPIPPLIVERLFDGATTRTDAIEACTRELLIRLSEQLQERESGVRSLALTLGRVDAIPIVLNATLSRPSRDPRHLWTLLRPQVERANLGFGVEHLHLHALRIGRLKHTQAEHWPGNDASPTSEASRAESAALIDLLSSRIGAERVTRIDLLGTHIPERAASRTPAIETHSPPTTPARTHSATYTPTALDHAPARPSFLFQTPEPADVLAMVPDRPPSRLRWRGREHIITIGLGPERIAPEWWRARTTHEPEPTRDYYRICDAQGLWLWVYRELETTRWFVQGIWA